MQTSMTLTVTATGGGLTGATFVPPQCPLGNSAATRGGPEALVLAAGANVVPAPPGAIGYIICPPIPSANAKIVNDTGAGSTGITFSSSPVMGQVTNANLYINSAASETCTVQWF